MNLFNKILRCEHRHDINHHPGCFHAGNVNNRTAQKIYEENGKPWYHLDGLRIGYLDIESGGLKPDFDPMLSWCIKTKEGDVAYDVIKREELFEDGVDGDARLVSTLLKEMEKYKIIVTYYGTGFDVPFIRTKAMRHNLYFPAYLNEEYEKRDGTVIVKSVPEMFHFDLYYLVKSKMLLSRYSLDNACDFLGIEGKTPLSKNVWRKAKYGDPEALDLVLEHNIGDVIILEQLHDRLEPFSKWIRKPL